jgi:hypothetical protein
MRIRGYLPRGISLTWVLGIPLEQCNNQPTKELVRDIISRFIDFALGNVPVTYDFRELGRSYLVRFTAKVAEPSAMCRSNSDYEFKDCVYTCVSSNIPLSECEDACLMEVADMCEKYGHTASWMNVTSLAHDLASLFEACNVRYYSHFVASKELYSTWFVAFFE